MTVSSDDDKVHEQMSVPGPGLNLATWFVGVNKSLDKCRSLEDFRIKYEAEFGETDITKRYTTMLPIREQTWLLKNHPKRYWEGMPPFLQAWIKRNIDYKVQTGTLDEVPVSLIQLYMRDQLIVGRKDQERQ